MSYNPYRHLGSLRHLTFGITRLPIGKAWWLPAQQAIVLDDRLTAAERRCRLAHELVHAEDGDTQQACRGAGTDRIARRREAHVEKVAAKRLIPLEALIDALRWTLNDEELADYLGVDIDAARARRDALSADECRRIDHELDDESRWIA